MYARDIADGSEVVLLESFTPTFGDGDDYERWATGTIERVDGRSYFRPEPHRSSRVPEGDFKVAPLNPNVSIGDRVVVVVAHHVPNATGKAGVVLPGLGRGSGLIRVMFDETVLQGRDRIRNDSISTADAPAGRSAWTVSKWISEADMAGTPAISDGEIAIRDVLNGAIGIGAEHRWCGAGVRRALNNAEVPLDYAFTASVPCVIQIHGTIDGASNEAINTVLSGSPVARSTWLSHMIRRQVNILAGRTVRGLSIEGWTVDPADGEAVTINASPGATGSVSRQVLAQAAISAFEGEYGREESKNTLSSALGKIGVTVEDARPAPPTAREPTFLDRLQAVPEHSLIRIDFTVGEQPRWAMYQRQTGDNWLLVANHHQPHGFAATEDRLRTAERIVRILRGHETCELTVLT